MLAVAAGPDGPRWVTSTALFDLRARVEQTLPRLGSSANGAGDAAGATLVALAYTGEGYLASSAQGPLVWLDREMRASRVHRGRGVAAELCGPVLEETPSGAVLAYYERVRGACGAEGEAHPWLVQKLDAQGNALTPPVPVSNAERVFLSVRPRWEAGRVVLSVDAVGGERISMILDEALRVSLELRGSIVCGRPGCARFAVTPSGGGPGYESSTGTVRLDAVNYVNTTLISVFADEIIDARAREDFALLVYRGRVNGSASARAVAVVNLVTRQLEEVYDEFRGGTARTWGEDAPSGGATFVRSVGRAFVLGAGGWEQGALLHRSIECAR